MFTAKGGGAPGPKEGDPLTKVVGVSSVVVGGFGTGSGFSG